MADYQIFIIYHDTSREYFSITEEHMILRFSLQVICKKFQIYI